MTGAAIQNKFRAADYRYLQVQRADDALKTGEYLRVFA